jgi:hypothetical protein
MLPKQWVFEEIKSELKNVLKQIKMETIHTKTHGIQQKHSSSPSSSFSSSSSPSSFFSS